MRRRDVFGALAAAAFPSLLRSDQPADFTLEIGPVSVELAPGTTVKTIGYNGSAPGPLLRVPEGKTISIDVHNNTGTEEVAHWHGLHIPSDVDGSLEEGTPPVPPHGRRRYSFTATPSGTRWYHSHVMAGRNLKRAAYTGQFGFFYIEPKSDPGGYDQEVFLALKEWDPYLSTSEDSMDAAYKHFSINGRALGHGDPIRVKERQRVLFRI